MYGDVYGAISNPPILTFKKRRHEQKAKMKKVKQVLRYLVPICKYFNPMKYIYYMDMVFPLNLMECTEKDFHMGKLALIRNAQIRPKIIYNKMQAMVMVMYESPSVNVIQNQSDYFLGYLRSLGDKTMKDMSTVLEHWRQIWMYKDLARFTENLHISEDSLEFESTGEMSANFEELYDYRAKVGNLAVPTTTSLRKVYYFERACKYKGNNIVSNVFVVGYSMGLLKMLGVEPGDFLKLGENIPPITIRPSNNLEYRHNLLSHIMHGKFPRLDSTIQIYGPRKAVVINPYASINRVYSLKDQMLNIRVTYSYKDDDDLSFYKRKTEEVQAPPEN